MFGRDPPRVVIRQNLRLERSRAWKRFLRIIRINGVGTMRREIRRVGHVQDDSRNCPRNCPRLHTCWGSTRTRATFARRAQLHTSNEIGRLPLLPVPGLVSYATEPDDNRQCDAPAYRPGVEERLSAAAWHGRTGLSHTACRHRGNAYSPLILGIGAEPGHHEHLSPSTRRGERRVS